MTDLLSHHLANRTRLSVSVGRPDAPRDATEGTPGCNLFLYEAVFDPSMRSLALDDGRPAPLWLALRYLLTAFDGSQSDTTTAHRSLGEAMRALQEIAYLPLDVPELDPDDLVALQVNPEPLKVSFVEAGSDLLGRLMQGSDEKYRFSISFEVRPVMIATRTLPESTLLVGHRYRGTDPRPPGVDIPLDPQFRAPTLTRVQPRVLQMGDTFQLVGSGFGAGDLACIGLVELAIASGTGPDAGQLSARLASPDRNGSAIAELITAGARAITVARIAVGGRRRVSNSVLVSILPTLATATRTDFDAATRTVTIDCGGELLGRDQDDTIVSLWDATTDRTIASSDEVSSSVGSAPQTARTVVLRGVPRGSYRVILRVNGVQAVNSPEVDVP